MLQKACLKKNHNESTCYTSCRLVLKYSNRVDCLVAVKRLVECSLVSELINDIASVDSAVYPFGLPCGS